jgi:hypothetical protein
MTGYEFIKTADDRFFVRAKQARARKGKMGVTGKELHRIATAILHSGIVGWVDAQDEDFLRWLLQYHSAAAEKIGCGAHHIEIRPNQFRSPAFWIVRLDGTATDFSFNVCISGAHPRRAVVYNALRNAVVDQVSEFKQKILLAGDARCAVTGASLYPSNSHADHVTPFKDLADQFIASVGGIDMIPIVPSADGVMQHHVADGVVKETWQAFHREHAVLRLVTAEANLKRKYGDA